jgi:hypothetical protein
MHLQTEQKILVAFPQIVCHSNYLLISGRDGYANLDLRASPAVDAKRPWRVRTRPNGPADRYAAL